MAENIFEKVLENVDIVDVVKSFVDLEPKGKNLFGLCPFHDDKNPSMSVSKEKGIFYCFTCKKGGNAIKFIELYKHMTSIEAARYLAEAYHIDVSEFDSSRMHDEKKRYYDCLEIAAKFYEFIMNDENASKKAREYLNKRGINSKIIHDFHIGLAPSDNKALTKSLEAKGFLISDLITCGLANENNDIFTDRIMIPIRNEQGKVVAFGGRIYLEGSTQAKYVNSKETPIFKKGELVFNLDRAEASLKTSDFLIINEGYMDVITAVSNGVLNSIALMGTSITSDQIELIKKYTRNVVICLDGDKPGMEGVKALVRGFEEAGINYAIALIPNDMDPDDYIRKFGVESYLKLINDKKMDKMGFIYELTKREYGPINSFNMDSFKNNIFEKIKDEKSRSLLESYLRRLSLDLNVSFLSLNEDFNSYMERYDPDYRKEKIVKAIPFTMEGSYRKAEHMIVDYAIKDLKYFESISVRMGGRVFLRSKDLRAIYISIGDCYDSNPKITSTELLKKLKDMGCLSDFIFDEKIDFSMEDLQNNVLQTLDKEELKEKIMDLKKRVQTPGITEEELKELLLELQKKQKELRK